MFDPKVNDQVQVVKPLYRLTQIRFGIIISVFEYFFLAFLGLQFLLTLLFLRFFVFRLIPLLLDRLGGLPEEGLVHTIKIAWRAGIK